jgi:hypothetical protein
MDLNSLYKRLRLRVAAHALHEQADKRIRTALDASALAPARFRFNAYVCETPAIRSQKEEPVILAPFIDREMMRSPLIFNLPSETTREQKEEFLSRIRDEINRYEARRSLPIPLAYTDHTTVFTWWNNLSVVGPISAGTVSKRLYDQWKGGRAIPNPAIESEPFTATMCIQDILEKLNNGALSPDNKLAFINIIVLLYYDLLASTNPNDCLFYVGVPLSTSLTFHGVLIASFEVANGATIDPQERLDALDRVGIALAEEAQETYLPTLILTQNSWEEHALHEYIKIEITGIDKNSAKYSEATQTGLEKFQAYADRTYSKLAQETVPTPSPAGITENDILEHSITDLWRSRIKDSEFKLFLKDSLIFRKMMVASPGMIRSVKQVAKLDIVKPNEPPLPAVLIVAPPGSGKENMSRLIPLFSKDYWNKKVVTINMGSIPLTDTNESLNSIYSEVHAAIQADGVLILDELNSLDISAQPLLLRLLEQGEISAFKSETKVSWLVIGLINEPPSRLTLESIREKVSDRFLFGEILGSAFYEHWKRQSRLRDDLYYRISRSGEVHVDGLNDRRPDIPIVFYFLLRKLFHETPAPSPPELFLTYDAMMRLIDESLDWKGNIRKLEAVARQLKGNINLTRRQEPVILINGNDVEKALRAIGMLRSAARRVVPN